MISFNRPFEAAPTNLQRQHENRRRCGIEDTNDVAAGLNSLFSVLKEPRSLLMEDGDAKRGWRRWFASLWRG